MCNAGTGLAGWGHKVTYHGSQTPFIGLFAENMTFSVFHFQSFPYLCFFFTDPTWLYEGMGSLCNVPRTTQLHQQANFHENQTKQACLEK
jgi:hypothetical protein